MRKTASQHFLGDLYPTKRIGNFTKLGRIKFPNGHSHANGAYKKDLDDAHPIVFTNGKPGPGRMWALLGGTEAGSSQKRIKKSFRE